MNNNITKAAKRFLISSNNSTEFVQAANFTVSCIMAAIEQKVETGVRSSTRCNRPASAGCNCTLHPKEDAIHRDDCPGKAAGS